MTDINTLIGNHIRRSRKVLGMKQADLGAAVGIRFQQIQKYEAGANQMSAARIAQVVKALGMLVANCLRGFDR